MNFRYKIFNQIHFLWSHVVKCDWNVRAAGEIPLWHVVVLRSIIPVFQVLRLFQMIVDSGWEESFLLLIVSFVSENRGVR